MLDPELELRKKVDELTAENAKLRADLAAAKGEKPSKDASDVTRKRAAKTAQ